VAGITFLGFVYWKKAEAYSATFFCTTVPT